MRRAARTLTGLLALALGLGCGPSRAQVRATRPFSAAMGRIFDDSVDYVESVEGLGGRVAAEWQTQIDGLTRSSDLIALARVETVLVETDPEGGRSYRLTVALSDTIKGELPPEARASLRVTEGQVGFRTVAGRESRLQSSRYIAFIRWYTDGAGEVRAHWHLSPESATLLSRVRSRSGWSDRNEGVERVVRQDAPQKSRGRQRE